MSRHPYLITIALAFSADETTECTEQFGVCERDADYLSPPYVRDRQGLCQAAIPS